MPPKVILPRRIVSMTVVSRGDRKCWKCGKWIGTDEATCWNCGAAN